MNQPVNLIQEHDIRGQIDIGASASCTGNRDMLHDYIEFGPSNEINS